MTDRVIDMHVHVGLRGDVWPEWGKFSDHFMRSPTLAGLLLYGGMTYDDLTDERMKAATLKAIAATKHVDRVVCLAMDPAFDKEGNSLADKAHMWVANEYVLELRNRLPTKILFGASVHPYDPKFEERIRAYVTEGAVLVKWLPSAQAIDLADERVVEALKFLATAGKREKPLPLLLHVGSEYSVPPIDQRTKSMDFLSWSKWDRIRNWFRVFHPWHRPDVSRIGRNLHAGLDAGAVIIFAHCGLPYFAWSRIGKRLEHSDLDAVSRYLREPAYRGKAFADVSAIVTPMRHTYFPSLRALPEGSLVFGSDFPVPIFELSGNLKQLHRHHRAVIKGHLRNIVVPSGNLMDVNYHELRAAFGAGHRLFTNFASLM